MIINHSLVKVTGDSRLCTVLWKSGLIVASSPMPGSTNIWKNKPYDCYLFGFYSKIEMNTLIPKKNRVSFPEKRNNYFFVIFSFDVLKIWNAKQSQF